MDLLYNKHNNNNNKTCQDIQSLQSESKVYLIINYAFTYLVKYQ